MASRTLAGRKLGFAGTLPAHRGAPTPSRAGPVTFGRYPSAFATAAGFHRCAGWFTPPGVRSCPPRLRGLPVAGHQFDLGSRPPLAGTTLSPVCGDGPNLMSPARPGSGLGDPVPPVGFEPTRPFGQTCLRRPCQPVAARGQVGTLSPTASGSGVRLSPQPDLSRSLQVRI